MDNKEIKSRNIIFLTNKQGNTGAYVIIFKIVNDIEIKIGRKKNNKDLFFKKGNYVYIGSAMGKKGSTTIQNRVFRHTIRANKNPHTIQQELLKELTRRGIPPSNKKNQKRLKWNIDYLLENEDVIIEKILIIITETNLEEKVSQLLNQHPYFIMTYKRFGSTDLKNTQTNLLYTEKSIPEALKLIINQLETILL